jgi:uncharacterized protein (TIGR00661 family)
MKILFSCNEIGLGHVNRTILLGRELEKKDHSISFFSGGIAYELLKKNFKNVHLCTPIVWYESTYGIIESASTLNVLLPLPLFGHEERKLKIKKSVLLETVNRYYDIRKYVRENKPDIMISDGDVLLLRLASKWRIPCIYVTNLVRPSYHFPPFLYPGQRLTERYIRKCRKIIVPDVPRQTICEYNLGNLNNIGIEDKVEFSGSFFDVTYEKGLEDFIFVPISGPLGTKSKMAREIIPILSHLECKSIVSLGNPWNGLVKKIGNCEIHGWLPGTKRKECMKNADLVIFSGSHGTCFEIIKYRKPSICLPTQPEQKANAKKLEELGCSIYVENKKKLKFAIEKLKENKLIYKNNASKLGHYVNKFDGLEKATYIIENTL